MPGMQSKTGLLVKTSYIVRFDHKNLFLTQEPFYWNLKSATLLLPLKEVKKMRPIYWNIDFLIKLYFETSWSPWQLPFDNMNIIHERHEYHAWKILKWIFWNSRYPIKPLKLSQQQFWILSLYWNLKASNDCCYSPTVVVNMT